MGETVAGNETRMYLLCWEDVADQKHESATGVDHISSINNIVSKCLVTLNAKLNIDLHFVFNFKTALLIVKT